MCHCPVWSQNGDEVDDDLRGLVYWTIINWALKCCILPRGYHKLT